MSITGGVAPQILRFVPLDFAIIRFANLIADQAERQVWVMEIVGPGKDRTGAVWAAQRVPDEHVSVVANGARIGEIDLSQADFFMASRNVSKVAQDCGYWDPASGQPFRFYQAYDPDKDRERISDRLMQTDSRSIFDSF